MDFNEFQNKTDTFIKDSVKGNLYYFSLGLTGESGEVADKVKKLLRDGKMDWLELGKELGDVLFYVAQIAKCCGLTLEEVAQMNIDKLQSRKSRGKISGSGDNR